MGNYIPAVRVGNLLFLSGHGPIRVGDQPLTRGKVGRDMSIEDAYKVAREVGINLLGSARATLGSLDKVKRVVKVLGMVNAVESFGDQPKVINGFSDLMVEVFGENGRHARSAVGMGSLPAGIPVEIEMILELNGPAAAGPEEGGPLRAPGQEGREAPPLGKSGGSTRSASAIRGPYQDRSLPSTRCIRPSRTAGRSGYGAKSASWTWRNR